MSKDQLLVAIILSTAMVLLLLGFLIFVLFWQRVKNNRFLLEKELLETRFNEQLFKSKLEIQEQTFDTISMEIHDNVGQTLSLLRVQLNILAQKQHFDEALIADLKQNAGHAMSDLRDIAKSLSSERIQLSTLPELVKHELARLEQTGLIATEIELNGIERVIPGAQKLILFRMIQESLQNIVKHAHATKVNLVFSYTAEKTNITIIDNGHGFDESILEGTMQGLGLKNIRQRAKAIGGEATIHSVAGSGTTVTINVPYE